MFKIRKGYLAKLEADEAWQVLYCGGCYDGETWYKIIDVNSSDNKPHTVLTVDVSKCDSCGAKERTVSSTCADIKRRFISVDIHLLWRG